MGELMMTLDDYNTLVSSGYEPEAVGYLTVTAPNSVSGIEQTFYGSPVITSPYVPNGQVIMVAPQTQTFPSQYQWTYPELPTSPGDRQDLARQRLIEELKRAYLGLPVADDEPVVDEPKTERSIVFRRREAVA